MTPSPSIAFAVVIPAYKPSAGLVDLVRALSAKAVPAIVLVDDGSGPAFREVFERACEFPGVHLLRHAVNLGKGAALKTAFNYVLCTFPATGVVTADADGQHLPGDIERVAARLMAQPEALVLGSRTFGSGVPLRSRAGNIATRAIMHGLLGRKLTDTQTGLRGIPAALLPKLMRVEATGYEFELEMLLAAHHLSMTIAEEPIQTVYEPGNKSSHFNPIVDSMKIYFVLLRFGSVSLLSALLDNLIFYVVWRRSGNLLLSQVVARVFAVVFNYSMVRSSVFYSHQRHKTVLPKYLALVLASGAVSFFSIQFLNSRLGMPTVPAKLFIETVLFFVNFAVQRLFIFRSRENGSAATSPAAGPRVVAAALFAAAFTMLAGVEIYGFATARLFSQDIWMPVGIERFTRFIGVFLALAVPLLLMAPWIFPAFLIVLLTVLTGISVGFPALGAALLFLLSASALGGILLGRAKPATPSIHLLATLAGISVYIALMTLVARLPIHHPATWAVILAIPILADWRGVLGRFRLWAGQLRAATLDSVPARAAFALLAFLVVAHWFVALKPETGADGLAMHLAIPMNIAANHALTFEPATILWAVMPMGADWCYSIVYLLGGEYAARILNFGMLLILLGLLYSAARRWLQPAAAMLVTASFAATPVVQIVTGSLFVENLHAALLLGLLIAIWHFAESGGKRYLYISMLLAGAAVTTKLGSIAFLIAALPFLVAALVRNWKPLGRRAWLHCTLAALLLLATALPTFLIAYAKTGNPIFPFQNQKFRSPLLDPSISLEDARFRVPLDSTTLYTLTFRTTDVWEGQNGSFGFHYLVVVPLALLGLLVVRRNGLAAQSAVAVALVAGVIVMRSQPNVRYLYAAMPFALLGFAAVLGWMGSYHRWLFRALAVYLVAATALNAWFLPSSSFYHKDFCLRLPFSRAERDRFMAQAAPVRKVIEYYNRNRSDSAVLLAAGNEIAGIRGPVYENHWHQVNTQQRLAAAATLPDLFRLLQSWNVRYVITPKPTARVTLRPATLRKLIDVCTTPEFATGDIYLARVEPDCEERIRFIPVPTEPPMKVTAGHYDNTDPAILYRGEWVHDDSFTEPYNRTVSYTAIPGADFGIAFDGPSFTYMFTKAPNRGIVEVTIDGVSKGRLDLYSPDIRWQSVERYCCFAPGKHIAFFRVTGQRHPASSGVFVDVDAFIVR